MLTLSKIPFNSFQKLEFLYNTIIVTKKTAYAANVAGKRYRGYYIKTSAFSACA